MQISCQLRRKPSLHWGKPRCWPDLGMKVVKSFEPWLYLTVLTNSMSFGLDLWASCTSISLWPAFLACARHEENCARCGCVKIWMITRVVVSRLSLFSTDSSYLSSSLTHMLFSSITLRAPTCSDELPTLMIGQNFNTLTSSCLLVLSCSRRLHANPMQSRTRSIKKIVGDFRLCLKVPWHSFDSSVSTTWSCNALAPFPSHSACWPTFALCSAVASMKISAVSGASEMRSPRRSTWRCDPSWLPADGLITCCQHPMLLQPQMGPPSTSLCVCHRVSLTGFSLLSWSHPHCSSKCLVWAPRLSTILSSLLYEGFCNALTPLIRRHAVFILFGSLLPILSSCTWTSGAESSVIMSTDNFIWNCSQSFSKPLSSSSDRNGLVTSA